MTNHPVPTGLGHHSVFFSSLRQESHSLSFSLYKFMRFVKLEGGAASSRAIPAMQSHQAQSHVHAPSPAARGPHSSSAAPSPGAANGSQRTEATGSAPRGSKCLRAQHQLCQSSWGSPAHALLGTAGLPFIYLFSWFLAHQLPHLLYSADVKITSSITTNRNSNICPGIASASTANCKVRPVLIN